MRDFPLHTALTIALVGLALGGARMAREPRKANARGTVPVVIGASGSANLSLPRSGEAGNPPLQERLLADSSGVLDHFYAALQRTESKAPGAITRIVHYGDSPTTADLITGDVRAILQAQFGDAGHGFILPAKPWAWYGHTGTEVEGKGWQMLPASRFQAHDGLFGLGGVSFTGASATSRITFRHGGYTRFELWYLQQPDGGTVTLSSGDLPIGTVTTAGEKSPGFARFDTKEPVRTLELHASHARIFGITAENPGLGVVYDSLGLNGASTTVLTRMFNEAHWAAELQHRDPALVIINYGTNEADFADFVETHYEKELREAIRRTRAALPEVSILIMSPMDRGHKDGSGEIVTMPTIPQLVAIQRRVAQETGCGFFDTFHAMGGEGTMAKWYTSQPRLVSADLIHPYPAGGKLVAEAFTRELIDGLNRFKTRTVSAVR